MDRVELSEYDPAWPRTFERLRAAAWPLVRAFALRIEHVGSTAVPSLIAKPIIDIDVVVRDATDGAMAISRLETVGYRSLGDLGIAGRQALAPPPHEVPHHLYVVEEGCIALRNHVLLRDVLRTDPAAAADYARLKRSLAASNADRESYCRGKTEFIVSLLQRAGVDEAAASMIREQNRSA